MSTARMETVKEITRVNRLLEVEEMAFQWQLEDAVSFDFLHRFSHSPQPVNNSSLTAVLPNRVLLIRA